MLIKNYITTMHVKLFVFKIKGGFDVPLDSMKIPMLSYLVDIRLK